MLGQLRGSEIAIDSLGIDDAQLFQSVSFHLQNLLCKMSSRRKWRAAFLYVDYTIRLGRLTVLFCIFPKNFSVSLKVFYHFFSRGGSIPFSLQKISFTKGYHRAVIMSIWQFSVFMELRAMAKSTPYIKYTPGLLREPLTPIRRPGAAMAMQVNRQSVAFSRRSGTMAAR